MNSLYETAERLLAKLNLKAGEVLGEEPVALMTRGLVTAKNEIALYTGANGEVLNAAGTPLVARPTGPVLVTVANAAARLALTTGTVMNGDHVKEADTGSVHVLLNQGAISSAGSWAKLTRIAMSDLTDTTAAGRALGGAEHALRQAELIGADGELLVWSTFAASNGTGSPDARLYISVSRDGLHWLTLNNGQAIYSDPASYVRDPSTYYDAAGGWWYCAYTTDDTGAHTGYFGIARSRSLKGPWTHFKNVSTAGIVNPANSFTWDPCWFTTLEGVTGILISLELNSRTAGRLKPYWFTPNTAGDFGGDWSAVPLTMPNVEGYNDVMVWNSPVSGLFHMLAIDASINSAFAHFTSSALLGPWTRAHVYGGTDALEGIAFVPHIDREGGYLYFEGQGMHGGMPYRRVELDTNYAIVGGLGNYTEVSTSPLPAVPGRKNNFYNGQIRRYRFPEASLLMPMTVTTGTMAFQNSGAVAITGGTLSGVEITAAKSIQVAPGGEVRVPIHGAWDNGGLVMLGQDGSEQSHLGCGSDNRIYWNLPISGAGMHIFNGARNWPVFTFTEGGAFGAAGALTCASVATGAVAATGITIVQGANTGITVGDVGSGSRDRIDSGSGVVAFGFDTATSVWFGNGSGTGNVIIAGAGVPASTGERLQVNGTMRLGPGGSTLGRLRHGTVTLSGATAVTDASVTASSRVFLQRIAEGGTLAPSYTVTRSAGSGFTITPRRADGSTETAEGSTLAWMILEP